MDRAGHDPSFRRARLSRFADDETLDRLEAEHAELSIDERKARNERIDTLSDDEVRAELGDAVADDKPKRTTARRSAKDGDGDGDGE